MSAQPKKSKAFSTISVLSYIGNSICALLAMILLIASISNGTNLSKSGSFDALFGSLMGVMAVMAVMAVLVIVMCYLCIMGVAKMKKGNKRGLLYYLIGNGLWVVLLIYAGREGSLVYLSSALISIGFTGFYAMMLPKLS